MNPLHSAAHELHAAGITVIPVRSDGSKAPVQRGWQHHATTPADIDAWFSTETEWDQPRHTAMGIVCGPASGNLEMAEVEGAYTWMLTGLRELAADTGLGDLWDRLQTGWVEISPSGGWHWVYRVEGMDVPGNTKLAQDENRATIAETRGAGGQFVAAPTGGPGLPAAHDSGQPWRRTAGGPATIPTLTVDERDAFHALLGTLDRRPHPDDPRASTALTGLLGTLEQEHTARLTALGGLTPGDDYEQRTSWAEILEPAGWTRQFTRGRTTYWCRPGKNAGISATTGHADDRDRLYVFSSSTEFETFTPYTKFGALAAMHYGGDHTEAARRLADHGYGRPAPTPAAPAAATSPPSAPSTPSSPAAPSDAAGENMPAAIPAAPAAWGHDDAELRSHQRMATRLAAHATARLRYIVGTATGWHSWDGTRWAPDLHHARAYAELRHVLATSWDEALTAGKDLATDVKSGMSASGAAGILALASRDPRLILTEADTDPWLLNAANGTIDLRTGTLRPHDPADNITKITAAAFNPDQAPGPWADWLPSVLPDPEVAAFVQRLIGYALIGKPIEHIFPVAHGQRGRNGKSLLAGTVLKALGDYGVTVDPSMLVRGRYGDKKTAGEQSALMTLRGARLVVMSELNQGDHIDEAAMKALTGGDRITAKYMGRDMVTFDPSHTFLMLTNPLPAIPADSAAAWARVRIIPFNVSFEGREDTTLDDVLAGDLDGVLAWALAGLADYHQRGGLDAPEAVLAATSGEREKGDPVSRFIEDRCFLGPAASAARRALYDAYTDWAKMNGETEYGNRRFNDQIRALPGVSETKARGNRGWVGIGLAAILEDEKQPFGSELWSN